MLNVTRRSMEFSGKTKRFLLNHEKTITKGSKLQALGDFISRYALVLTLFWIGGMKFTAFEAAGIQPSWDEE